MKLQRRKIRSAFTMIEMLAVIGVLAIVMALLMPAIQSARETQRRNDCVNNLKQLALGLLNYEDKRHCLPPISTNVDSVPDIPGDASALPLNSSDPGAAKGSTAGCSWLVLLLPDWCDMAMYQAIKTNTKNFSRPAFSPEIVTDGTDPTSPHIATVRIGWYLCPSSDDRPFLEISPRTVGVANGPVETGTLPPNYVGKFATANRATGIAMTSYNAIAGTHIDPVTKSVSSPNTNNGGMKFRGTAFDQGRKLSELTDGTSKVPLVAETRERRFSSWYDGTMNWVVAARHSNPSAGTTPIIPASNTVTGKINGLTVDGNWVVGTDGTSATGGSTLNYGPTAPNPTAVYLPNGAISDPDISGAPPGRLWGPSSEHRGGIVNHAFADGHVEPIADTIDPNLYLWIVTRNGGEKYTPQ